MFVFCFVDEKCLFVKCNILIFLFNMADVQEDSNPNHPAGCQQYAGIALKQWMMCYCQSFILLHKFLGMNLKFNSEHQ